MSRTIFLVLLAIILLGAGTLPITGTAEVVDGDTLRIGDTKIRLFGIDAPEARQVCESEETSWGCGEASTRQLQSLVEGQPVACLVRGIDDYGRSLAVCTVGGLELNRTMVAQGWAVAFRRYSGDYVTDEIRAKASGVGIWKSAFVLPEDFRQAAASAGIAPKPSHATSRLANVAPAPGVMGRCAIKGNRNRRGQWIYHVPGMPYYEATRAEEIFCTEAEARAAGYRRAIVK